MNCQLCGHWIAPVDLQRGLAKETRDPETDRPRFTCHRHRPKEPPKLKAKEPGLFDTKGK